MSTETHTEAGGLAEVIRSVTDLWDEPLDEVHDVPQIVNAVLAAGYRTEGVGTGAGEGAPRQDTGSAWVTRSADCPEDPAQAHPLFFLTARLTDDDVVEAGARAIAEVSESEGGGYWHPDTAWYWKKRARAALAAAAAVIGGER